jgi:hypothetical protein
MEKEPVKVVYSVDESKTHYVTVDLDVWSRGRLDTFAQAVGRQAGLHYVGPEGGVYGAHFGVRLHPDEDASRAILALAAVIRSLPPAPRRLWDRAYRREFNIGIQAADQPRSFELFIAPRALRAVVALNATVAMTVYAPERNGDPPTPPPQRRARGRLSNSRRTKR